MESNRMGSGQLFRLWITTYAEWQPAHWGDLPPMATALEPVENGLYSADEAALFLEGFNEAMLQGSELIWAVAIPVTIRYEGDAQPGMPIQGHAFPRGCVDLEATSRNDNVLAEGGQAGRLA